MKKIDDINRVNNTTKHPGGLWVLSFSECIGRLSYYGLQTSFLLYLTKSFLFSNHHSYLLFGVFTALAFSSPVIGGLLGDRLFGIKRATIFGLILNVIGNVLLASSSTPMLFYIGIAIFVMGIGLFKSNASTLLGQLYREHDAHKEQGVSLYYAAMNLGAILGPLAYGVVISLSGWHAAFLVGAVMEFLALCAIVMCQHKLVNKLSHTADNISIKLSGIKTALASTAVVLLVLAITWLLINYSAFNIVFIAITLSILAWVIGIIVTSTKLSRNQVILIVLLDCCAVFYFSCQIQVSSTILMFTEHFIRLNILHWHIPSQFYTVLEPAFIVLLTPFFAKVWLLLSKRRQNQSIVCDRVGLGLLFAALSFSIFYVTAKLGGYLPLAFSGLVLGNIFLSAGELCIGPAMIIAVTQWVPIKHQSTFMGIWWFVVSLAYYVSNTLIASLVFYPGQSVDSRGIYTHLFSVIAIIMFLITIGFMLLKPALGRLADQ